MPAGLLGLLAVYAWIAAWVVFGLLFPAKGQQTD